MSTQRPTICAWVACAAFVVLLAFGASRARAAVDSVDAGRPAPPRLSPDYTDIVIPPNIAPLNFKVQEPGVEYRVEFRSLSGQPITITRRDSRIQIPRKAWNTLLRDNAGSPLYCDVSVRDAQNQWRRFGTITNTIAPEEIDGVLAYRLLKPVHNLFVTLGIYQRDLRAFDEMPLIQNQRIEGGCLNCHTFLDQRTDHFALQIRSAKGTPMLLAISNEVSRVDHKMGYLSWHPSGRLLAFSDNKFTQFFHTMGEARDVFDSASNLGIYRVDSNAVVTPPAIALTNRNETWPAWSPDGRYLYYCSAPVLPLERFRLVLYDLMRISYDIERDQWGEPEVLVSSRDTALSANQPKVSPDGKYVLFSLSQYGNFPIFQPSCDLYLWDVETRRSRRLEINSNQSDSWHSWSSSSRWVVFSSKRMDGLFARPFFCYVDQQGRFHKPFVLPQEDPEFYDTCLNTFNVPEFVKDRIVVKQRDLVGAVMNPSKVRVLKPQSKSSPPDQQPEPWSDQYLSR